MEWTISKDKRWSALCDEFDWVRDMQGVIQDPRHHAEGDVAIHTQMVLAALENLTTFQALAPAQQELLWASALLHDVEKRSTTVIEDDGSITSRGHARRGMQTARKILYVDVETPFVLREQIAALVRYHGLPLWILEKHNPRKALLEAASLIDLRWLSMLARADVLGRQCSDQDDLLERIDFFDAFAVEQGCWTHPYPFGSDAARFHYFYRDDADPTYIPFDDSRCEVVMLSGLPGMGKDHYISKHLKDWPVISLDDIRRQYKLKPEDTAATGWVVQEAKARARAFLRQGTSFVLNATHITRQLRQQWIDLLVTYRARVRVVYLEVPYRQWRKQNATRAFPVPQAVLDRMLDKWEVPRPYEAHQVSYEFVM